MDKEEKIIHDIIDEAIIKSFFAFGAESLMRKVIVKKAHELSEKPESTIGKRIDKRQKEPPKDYLVKASRGIYSLNPKYEFKFEGEPLPGELKSELITTVSEDMRRKHTADLHKAINSWIENFPEPPHSKKSFEFSINADKCEQHILFSDLCHHLSESGFGVYGRWESYKANVIKLDNMKYDLLNIIKSNISEIFVGLDLKFVNRSDNLNDYECSLPMLLFNYLLDLKIHGKVGPLQIRNARTNEEQCEIESELMRDICSLELVMGRIQDMIFINRADSVFWGETGDMARKLGANERLECICVPKSDLDAIKGVKKQVVSCFRRPPAKIESLSDDIIKKVIQLSKERDGMLNELEHSLYCLSFSGDCKYLGGGSK